MEFIKSLSRLFVISILLVLITTIFPVKAFSQESSDEKPKLDIENIFTASGWMGDGEHGRKYIDFNGAYETNPHSEPTCIRIKYTFGPYKWAGIYWQNKPDNWGDKQGNNYSKKGFKKLIFWARGEKGTEVVEFKAGGINDAKKPYKDSFEETYGRVRLSKDWKKYTINLEHANLSSVIGGFCWVASSDYNNKGSIIFYVDDIYLE